jgi:hypothetical protein
LQNLKTGRVCVLSLFILGTGYVICPRLSASVTQLVIDSAKKIFKTETVIFWIFFFCRKKFFLPFFYIISKSSVILKLQLKNTIQSSTYSNLEKPTSEVRKMILLCHCLVKKHRKKHWSWFSQPKKNFQWTGRSPSVSWRSGHSLEENVSRRTV